MNNSIINEEFIIHWESVYDQLESDEDEYQKIVSKVQQEIQAEMTIEKQTFYRLIHWKSPRAKGKIKLDLYETVYKRAINQCLYEKSIRSKLECLVRLDGIGVPVASTILHFMEPSKYPIIDVRTIGTLSFFKYDVVSSITISTYHKYYAIIHNIQKSTNMSLRKIDRALFAFNKAACGLGCKEDYNQSSLGKTDCQQHDTVNDDLLNNLAKKYVQDLKEIEIFQRKGVWQKVKLNYLGGYILTKNGKSTFSPLEIRDVIRNILVPQLNDLTDQELAGIVLTQDVHLKSKKEYNNGYPCLEKVGRGEYRFVGFEQSNDMAN